MNDYDHRLYIEWEEANHYAGQASRLRRLVLACVDVVAKATGATVHYSGLTDDAREVAINNAPSAIEDMLALAIPEKRPETFDDGWRFACEYLKEHPDPAVRRIQMDIAQAAIERRKVKP